MIAAPTVYVFAQMVGPQGESLWQRYVVVGDDHQAAASMALRAWSGGWRILEVETFDGAPQRWQPGAIPAERL